MSGAADRSMPSVRRRSTRVAGRWCGLSARRQASKPRSCCGRTS